VTTDRLDYADIQAAVESGFFLAFAAGRLGDEPATAWFAAVLDGEAATVALGSHEGARAAQGIGAISQLRRHARRQGFTPA
jgi:hypothetical protein